MSEDVERYLGAIDEIARAVLEVNFVGTYAAGSLGLNAFQVDRSDVDMAVLCRDPVSVVTKRQLVARLRHSALPCPVRGLELVVYTEATARSGGKEPGFELELNDGPGMEFRQTLHPADRPPADGTFWYGLDRSILHQSGRVLSGPPAAAAFGELSAEDLRVLLIDSLHWWMARPTPADDDTPAPGAGDAVLGACRALVRYREGVWLSKIDAGRRVLATRSDPAMVIEQAIAARSGRRPPSGPQSRAFQRSVLEEIAAPT